jgi:hypothetical protein
MVSMHFVTRPVIAILGMVLLCLAVGAFSSPRLNTTQPGAPKKISLKPHVVKHRPKAAALPAPKPYEFPAGGRELFPKYRLVALYGLPTYPVLGVLGAQDLPASIARVKQLAATYQPLSKETIYPAFEMIATVASAEPTDNGDYSRETDVATLLPWVQAAREAGVYVVLDLQPGHADFLSQAKMYESLLKEPNVGLALDPEWRLGPGQRHLINIGSVSIDEVNQTAAWLAALTAQNKLPQKLFLLHEFRLDMISNRDLLNVNHPQLAYAIQMDGQGTQQVKRDTWHSVTAAPPANTYFGWKNFYQKDSPMLTPDATMAITPTPAYISYQ